jgi:hypothetical protein
MSCFNVAVWSGPKPLLGVLGVGNSCGEVELLGQHPAIHRRGLALVREREQLVPRIPPGLRGGLQVDVVLRVAALVDRADLRADGVLGGDHRTERRLDRRRPR